MGQVSLQVWTWGYKHRYKSVRSHSVEARSDSAFFQSDDELEMLETLMAYNGQQKKTKEPKMKEADALH